MVRFASTFVGALAVALCLITFPAVRYYNLSDFLLYGASELLSSGEWVTPNVASRPGDVENSGNSTLPELLSASQTGPRRPVS